MSTIADLYAKCLNRIKMALNYDGRGRAYVALFDFRLSNTRGLSDTELDRLKSIFKCVRDWMPGGLPVSTERDVRQLSIGIVSQPRRSVGDGRLLLRVELEVEMAYTETSVAAEEVAAGVAGFAYVVGQYPGTATGSIFEDFDEE